MERTLFIRELDRLLRLLDSPVAGNWALDQVYALVLADLESLTQAIYWCSSPAALTSLELSE